MSARGEHVFGSGLQRRRRWIVLAAALLVVALSTPSRAELKDVFKPAYTERVCVHDAHGAIIGPCHDALHPAVPNAGFCTRAFREWSRGSAWHDDDVTVCLDFMGINKFCADRDMYAGSHENADGTLAMVCLPHYQHDSIDEQFVHIWTGIGEGLITAAPFVGEAVAAAACIYGQFYACAVLALDVSTQAPAIPNFLSIGMVGNLLAVIPKLQASFRNNAVMPVGFALEVTANGEVAAQPDVSLHVHCIANRPDWACELGWWQNPDWGQYVEPGSTTHAFQWDHVQYDTEYCFRIRAFSPDDPQAENWSKPTCKPIPPVPPVPLAPRAVMDTVPPSGAPPPFAVLRDDQVCASNISGQTCSMAMRPQGTPGSPGPPPAASTPAPAASAGRVSGVYDQRKSDAVRAAVATSKPAPVALGRVQSAGPRDPGNKAMDPASEAIGNSLSAAGQRGFDASVALHLAQN